jgi:EmrB/QacA subfamily drug resistance transporter
MSALLLALASGAILVPLNTTMLAVALPGIMDEFELGANAVASLVTLYLGAVAITLPVSGALADRFGHRRTFVAGVLTFGAASLAAAVGDAFPLLQGARLLQAVSGGLVSTASVAIIREIAPPGRRGEVFGRFDLLTSTSAAIGPFVGGVLIGAFTWRSMFYLAAPVAIASAVAVWKLLPGEPKHDPAAAGPRSIDIPGLVVLGALIVAIIVALRVGPTGVGLAALAALVPLGAAFLAVELRTPYPAVDPRLFRSPAFASAAAGIFGTTVVLHGSFILIPLLVESLLGASATASGVVLLGVAGVGAVVAPWGGRASDRLGRRRLAVAGSLATAAGIAVLAAGMQFVTAVPLPLVLAAIATALGIVGLGMGLSGSPRQTAALEAVPSERAGMGAGTYLTARYLGGLVGASLAGAVLQGQVSVSGMTLGFGILAAAGLAVVAVSFGLPGRATRASTESASAD